MKRINYVMLACLLLGGLSFANVKAEFPQGDGVNTSPKKESTDEAHVDASSSADQVADQVMAPADIAVPTVMPVVATTPVVAPLVFGPLAAEEVPTEAEEAAVTGNKRERTESEEDKEEVKTDTPLAKALRMTPVQTVQLDAETCARLDVVVAAMANELETPEQRDAVARELETAAHEVVADIENPGQASGSSSTGSSSTALGAPPSTAVVPWVEGGPLVPYPPHRPPHRPSYSERFTAYVVDHSRAVLRIAARFAAYTGLALILSERVIAHYNAIHPGAAQHIGEFSGAARRIRGRCMLKIVGVAAAAELIYAIVKYVYVRLRTQPR